VGVPSRGEPEVRRQNPMTLARHGAGADARWYGVVHHTRTSFEDGCLQSRVP